MTEKTILSEEQLEVMVLRCIVCGDPIPNSRARRRKDTCCVEHYELLRQWRKWLRFSHRCLSCHAPYTMKQREEFKEWRRATGQKRRRVGRPKKTEQALPNSAETPKDVDTAALGQDMIAANPT